METEAYDELFALEPNHWWYQGMRQIIYQVLSINLPCNNDLHILDAGCGVGGNLTALSMFGKTSGFDYSSIALNYANKYCSGKLLRATVERLPYADNAFDLVTSFDVLCCREVDNDVLALSEFARVLRPGGHVLVRLPALNVLRGPHDIVVHGERRYNVAGIKQKMLQAGLSPAYCTYANSLLMPLIFIIRQLQNFSARRGNVPQSDVKLTPALLNTLLTLVLKFEAVCIRARVRFPAGVSVICLAVKPDRNRGLSSVKQVNYRGTTRGN